MGDIEDIIGVNNKDDSKASNKTSIMTTSGGKTLKRKHDEDAHDVLDDENVGGKKLAAEKIIMGDKPEITITWKSKEATDVNA
jgi:hypothetical protein